LIDFALDPILNGMKSTIKTVLQDSAKALESLSKNNEALSQIEKGAQILIKCFKNGGRVFSCGNGGSMSDAIHFAEELSARYRNHRRALPATAISDVGHLTCVGNDYGFDFIFSRYIEAHGKSGDVLLGISTSGKSKNVIEAAKKAKEMGLSVVTLTGNQASALANFAECDICTPVGQYADRIQELHIKVIHILIELIEREFFPQNY
jgi:D-sedoheptulose 7-phosphate isomerase